MVRKRLTRGEKQAHTRHCLMTSAAKVFADRGLAHSSIDEVAADAGYTKGAFYANFRNKEELFLAMLDERFAARIEDVDRAVHSGGTVAEQARAAGDDFARAIASDPEWERLFFEFCAYAARNDEFREELNTRNRALRERITDLFATSNNKTAEQRPHVDRVTKMTCAMASGVALEKLLDPEEFDDDLYPEMLTLLFAGLQALYGQGESGSEPDGAPATPQEAAAAPR